jgi:hypothetical protein
MQSFVMAIRSFLMISCMIIVPVLAIFGTDWLKEFGIGTSSSGPRRSSAAARRARTGMGDHAMSDAKAKAPGVPSPANVGQTPAAAAATPATALASAEAQAATPVAVPAWPNSGQPAVSGQPVQANFEAPLPVGPAGAASQKQVVPVKRAAAGARPAAAGPVPGGSNDWFTWTQHRLRELGATYYLLETWGRNGELYRFHCKMAVAGNPDYTRHFEATDSDASRAMQQVLEQVEAWRAGRGP